MNLLTGTPLVRTSFQQALKLQIRTLSSQKGPKKLPEEIMVVLATGKLFEGQNLNQNYINEQIMEGIKKHLPKKITVRQTSATAQPTVYTQPAPSSADFLLYYLFYLNLAANNHHHSFVDYEYAISYKDSIDWRPWNNYEDYRSANTSWSQSSSNDYSSQSSISHGAHSDDAGNSDNE